MAELFNNGFEEGTFVSWTGTSGAPTIVTNPVHHGTYAMLTASTGTSYCYKTLGSSYNTLYARFYFRTPVLPTSGNQVRFMQMCQSGGTGFGYLDIYVSGSTEYLRVRSYYPDTSYDVAFDWNINTWYCIEFKTVRATVPNGGGYWTWIDGVAKHAQSCDTSGLLNMQMLRLGRLGTSPTGQLSYDCVIMADAYIGVEGAGGVTVKKGSSVASTMAQMLNSKMLFSQCNPYSLKV